jgi:hypothetical protein
MVLIIEISILQLNQHMLHRHVFRCILVQTWIITIKILKQSLTIYGGFVCSAPISGNL